MVDVIIIGSSPLAITEAVFLKGNNKSVLNLDEKSVPGGAWVTVNYKKIPKVEIGCHIWSYNKSAYKFISDFFEIEILNLPVQPKIIYKNKFVAYDLKANIITLKALVKKTAKFNLSIKEFRQNPEMRLSLIPSKYKYPRFGAKDLEEAVHRKIDKSELNVRLNTTVKSVELSKSGGILYMANGEQECFSDELVLTSLSQLEKITFEDGTFLIPKTRKVEYIHRHLIIKGVIKKKFSYLRLLDDELIHRISDMTSQVKDELAPGTFLICVGIHEVPYYANNAFEQESKILKTLVSLKLFKPGAEVTLSDSNVFPSYYNDSDVLREIEQRSNKKVRFLRTTDFIYSFYNQLSRYQTLLD